ncbi:MAG: hypothetical protein COB65_01195 [Thalassobium sp.]|nr:MAG: hypothetical protein COB65_01195 [Thalassobium sp.]
MELWNELTGNSAMGLTDGNIQSSQGFWIHAISPVPSVDFQENDKTVNASGIFKAPGVEAAVMSVKISSGNNVFWDRIVIGTVDDADEQIDQYDQYKLYAPSTGAPNIASMSGTLDMAMNYFNNWDVPRSIPLKIKTPTGGAHSLFFDQVSDLNASCLVLHDNILGTDTPITDSMTYSFNSMFGYEGIRFNIVSMGRPNTSSLDASCDDSGDGEIIINNSQSGVWTYVISDDNGLNITNTSTADSIIQAGLNSGIYYVYITENSLCGTVSYNDTVEIQNATPLTSIFGVSSDTLLLMSGVAELQTTNLSVNGTSYLWSFGDGNTSNLSAPVHFYNTIGTYTVELEVVNGLCVNSSDTIIYVSAITGVQGHDNPQFSLFQSGHSLVLNLGGLEMLTDKIEVLDMAGRVLDRIDSGISERHLIGVQNLASGIYLVRLTMSDGTYATQKVPVNLY